MKMKPPSVPKNKPKQTQFKPNFRKAEMNLKSLAEKSDLQPKNCKNTKFKV